MLDWPYLTHLRDFYLEFLMCSKQTKKHTCLSAPKLSKMANFLEILPLELRTLIYRELLLTENDPRLPGVDSRHSPLKTKLNPAILKVCRQINAEASVILYEGNHFTYSLLCMADNDLCHDRISMSSFKRIKHVSLCCGTRRYQVPK